MFSWGLTPQNLLIKKALLEQVNIKLSPSGNNLVTFRKISYLNVITTVLPAHKPLNKGPALFSKSARATVRYRFCEFWLVYIWCFGSPRDQNSLIHLKIVPRLSETKAVDPNLQLKLSKLIWLTRSLKNFFQRDIFSLFQDVISAAKQINTSFHPISSLFYH